MIGVAMLCKEIFARAVVNLKENSKKYVKILIKRCQWQCYTCLMKTYGNKVEISTQLWSNSIIDTNETNGVFSMPFLCIMC